MVQAAPSLMYSRGGLEPWSTEVAGVRHHTDVAKAFVDEREKLISNVHQTTSLHQKRSLHCLGLYFGRRLERDLCFHRPGWAYLSGRPVMATQRDLSSETNKKV